MSDIRLTLAAFADEAANSLDGQISAMKRNGLTHIELRGVNGKNCADLTADEARELKRRLDEEGLCVKSLGSPLGKIAITDDFEREMERFLRLTETAGILRADKVRIFSFYRDKTVSDEEGYALALERLNRFAERAGSLILCHENEKGIYGDGWEFCKTICREIPKIRAVFDPANFVQCGVDTAQAWNELKSVTEYLHLKDALPSGIVVPCGEGIGNVPMILEDFLDRGGRFATLEPHLASFVSKQQLEKEPDKTCGYRYSSQNEAFDAAVVAVRSILGKRGVEAQ